MEILIGFLSVSMLFLFYWILGKRDKDNLILKGRRGFIKTVNKFYF